MTKIVFSGTSHTFGLGLELEFRPKYNDIDWLKENFQYPNPREDKDKKYWKKYRWSKLVCDDLGYEEVNVHDTNGHHLFGANGPTSIYKILTYEKFPIDDVKYVVIQLGGIRWCEEGKHDKDKNYPNTVGELLNLIENPPNPKPENLSQIIEESLEFFRNWDEDTYTDNIWYQFNKLRKKFPNITFLVLPWDDIFYRKGDKDKSIIKLEEYPSVAHYLQNNKLRIGDVALYHKVLPKMWLDEHANHKGHEWVAKQVINHIKNLQKNNEKA